MPLAGSSPHLGEDRGSHTLLDLLRNHTRYSIHAGSLTRRQTETNQAPGGSLVIPQKSCKESEALSLVGLLQHATKVVTPGRTFISTMYSAAAHLKRLSHFTRLMKDFLLHLRWWHLFATHWNGLSLFDCSLSDHIIFRDASGLWGCRAVLGTQWMQMAWSMEWSRKDIIAKEVPIVLNFAVWGPLLSGTRVEFKCDNSSVIDSVNKGSFKEPTVMHPLQCLWFFSAYFDIKIIASHISGKLNTAANKLSRNRSREFLQSNPNTSRVPVRISTPLLKIVFPKRLDWTAPSFLQHLSAS